MERRGVTEDELAAAEAAVWPLLGEAVLPRAQLVEAWVQQALAGAGVAPEQVRRRWQGIRRQAAALRSLADAALPAEQRAALDDLAGGEMPDLTAEVRRRVEALVAEREDVQAEACALRDQLRATAALDTTAGRAAYLAALAAAAASLPANPPPLPAIGRAVAAALGVRARNAQRLLAGIARDVSRQ